jgi:alkylhydroperoxidase family enzyme
MLQPADRSITGYGDGTRPERFNTMPRLPYLPQDTAEPADIVASIRRRRGGKLYNLDRMLLHSPGLAAGWNALFEAVRGERMSLSPRLRELAICLVAILNRADYELHHHAPLFLAAGGTRLQLDALRGWEDADRLAQAFDSADLAIIQLAREITREVAVGESTFQAVRAALGDDRAVVEAVGTIAAYNMVSRVLVALDVQPEHE